MGVPRQVSQTPTTPERLTSPETVVSTTSSKETVPVVVPSLTEVNPSEVDALLAQELNQLSIKDRERTMEEIHGVYDYCRNPQHDHYNGDSKEKEASPTDEEALLEQGLIDLQKELEALESDESTECYERALEQNSPLLHDRKFRIKLLYAEDHNAQKAAIRLVHYFDVAHELYGSAALMRPITWNDLSPNALEIMQSGCIQVAPFRDAAGRRIAVLVKDVGPGYSYIDRVRTIVSEGKTKVTLLSFLSL